MTIKYSKNWRPETKAEIIFNAIQGEPYELLQALRWRIEMEQEWRDKKARQAIEREIGPGKV